MDNKVLALVEKDLSPYEGWDKYDPIMPSITDTVEKPWYLASLYTIHPYGKQQACKDATKMSAFLFDNGYFIFSPVAYFHPISDYSDNIDNYDFWLTNCLKYVRLSRGLIVVTMINCK